MHTGAFLLPFLLSLSLSLSLSLDLSIYFTALHSSNCACSLHPFTTNSDEAQVKMLEPYNLSDEVQSSLMKNINKRLTPQAIKIRADVELSCFSYEGIDAIKAALKAAEDLSTDEMVIKIKLVAPPLYVMMTTSLDKEEGIAKLQEACDTITEIIKAKGGDINLKMPPRAVTERDDRLLNMLMETLEKQNQEVDGDDDEED